jgi:hypothetical protein
MERPIAASDGCFVRTRWDRDQRRETDSGFIVDDDPLLSGTNRGVIVADPICHLRFLCFWWFPRDVSAPPTRPLDEPDGAKRRKFGIRRGARDCIGSSDAAER